MSWVAGEVDRRLAGLIRIATVAEVDAGSARARVHFGGEAVSDWLPWCAMAAGGIRVWAPPVVGEQVAILAPGGETAAGVIVGSLFSAANAAPSSDGAECRIALGPASISISEGALVLALGGSTVTISPSGVAIEGGELIHNGINVGATHVHGGVASGVAQTDEPE